MAFEAIRRYINQQNSTNKSNEDLNNINVTTVDWLVGRIGFNIGGLQFKIATAQVNNSSDFYIENVESYDSPNYNHIFGNTRPIVFSKNLSVVEKNGDNEQEISLNNLAIYNSTIYSNSLNLSRNEPICNRLVPGSQIRTAIVTTEDFFYDSLLDLGTTVNDAHFIFGKDNDVSNKYLLPIKPLFFVFFSIDYLKDNLSFSINGLTITYSLRIPLKNTDNNNKRYAVLKKEYNINDNCNDIKSFRLSLFPLLRFTETINNIKTPTNNIYNVMQFGATDTNFTLDFFRYNDIKQESAGGINYARDEDKELKQAQRETDTVSGKTTHYRVKHDFDFIVVNNNNLQGILIPKFEPKSKNNDGAYFNVAMDFGTTNTHVEIKYGNNESAPLSITSEENLLAFLHKTDDNNYLGNSSGKLKDIYNYEFIPTSFNSGQNNLNIASFPTRTLSIKSTNDSANTLIDNNKLAFLYSNIGFIADSIFNLYDTNTNKYVLKNNLKPDFESEPNNDPLILVKNFIEELFILIRAKLIKNNYHPNQLRLIWTFPSTTTSGSFRDELKSKVIQPLFWEYFTEYDNNNLKELSESIAPFSFIRSTINTDTTGTSSDFINIDIGGGTTDIAIGKFNDINNIIISSIKFAGNDLWSGINNDKSAYLQAWERFKSDSLANPVSPLFIKYKSIGPLLHINSLDKINMILRQDTDSEFNGLFSSNTYKKLSFPLFYHLGVILYNTVSLLEKHNIKNIGKITFSGLGSKYIKFILRTDNDLKSFIVDFLHAYCKIKANNTSAVNEYTLADAKLEENPKEITAKGALLSIENIIQFDNRPDILFKVENNIEPQTDQPAFDENGEEIIQNQTNTKFVEDDWFKENIKPNLIRLNSILCLHANQKILSTMGLDSDSFSKLRKDIFLQVEKPEDPTRTIFNTIPFSNSFSNYPKDKESKTVVSDINLLVYAYKNVIPKMAQNIFNLINGKSTQ